MGVSGEAAHPHRRYWRGGFAYLMYLESPMRVEEVRVYRGPNPYGYRPVIRMTLDLEELEDYPSTRLPGFSDALVALVPTLQDHGCSYGEPGGSSAACMRAPGSAILSSISPSSSSAWPAPR